MKIGRAAWETSMRKSRYLFSTVIGYIQAWNPYRGSPQVWPFLTFKLEIFRTYLLFDIILRNDIKSDIYYIWFPINTGRLGQISYIAKSWQILIQKEALDVKYSSKLVSRSFKVIQVKNSKTRSKKFKFRTFLKSIHSTC